MTNSHDRLSDLKALIKELPMILLAVAICYGATPFVGFVGTAATGIVMYMIEGMRG